MPDDVPETRAPTADELALIHEVIDPTGLREKEVPTPVTSVSHVPRSVGCVTHAATACELFGVELPIVQTGMGWVAGPA